MDLNFFRRERIMRALRMVAIGFPVGFGYDESDENYNAFRSVERKIKILTTCKLSGQTGVEMEALTSASIAALTIYDMCKSVDRSMKITDVRLLHKSGGKSGTFVA